MTRSENMRRLWADTGFKARHSARASAHMTALNRATWTEERRAAASAKMRERNLAKSRERNAKRGVPVIDGASA